MTTRHEQARARIARRLRAAAAVIAVSVVAALWAPPAHADDLPPPQVRARKVTEPAVPARAPTPPRAVPAVAGTIPPGYVHGAPSEPVSRRGPDRHSTYVPPLGTAKAPVVPTAAPARAVEAAAPPPAPVRRGRVPVTTFRVAPAPTPNRGAPAAPFHAAPAATLPRVTTWSPRPARTATTPPSRAYALPAPRVAKVSPSYAELERTRAQVATSRPAPDATPRKRTLQRPSTATASHSRGVRGPELTVPMAPGQCAPVAPVRRTLPLRPPPGCTDDG